MILAYHETSLPARSTEEALALARRHRLALEIAHRGGAWTDRYTGSGVPIAAVQAWGMHELHPLAADPRRRRAARSHVEETLEIASRLGCPRIVTVCGFGHHAIDRPRERVLDLFTAVAPKAESLGVKVMIEPLGRHRASFGSPAEVESLLEALARPAVFTTVLDTGHLADSKIDLDAFFAAWQPPVEEIQLKGPDSRPPAPALPVGRWIRSLGRPPAVLAVEHRRPVPGDSLPALVSALRSVVDQPPAD